MFDDIDFLSPHSTARRPRRASPESREVELVHPSAASEQEKEPSWKTRLAALFQKPVPLPSPKNPQKPPQDTITAPPPSLLRHNAGSALQRIFHPAPAAVRPIEPPKTVVPPSSTPPVRPPVPREAATPAARPLPGQAVPVSPPHASLLSKMKGSLHHMQGKEASALSKEEESEKILEVNLLPERERAKTGYRARVTLTSAIMAGIIAAMGLGSLILRLRANIRAREQQLIVQEIAEVERQMVQRATHLEGALAYQQRSRAVLSLLRQQAHWLSLLAFLEESTSQDVYYGRMSADRTGGLALTAHARNFNAAAEQLTSFMRNPGVRAVSISPLAAAGGGEESEGEVSFEITLKLDPRVIVPQAITP